MKRIISIYSIIISALIAIGSFVSCSNEFERFDDEGTRENNDEPATFATRSAGGCGGDVDLSDFPDFRTIYSAIYSKAKEVWWETILETLNKQRRERGFWVYYNVKTREIFCGEEFPPGPDRSDNPQNPLNRSTLHQMPKEITDSIYVCADYHTHPPIFDAHRYYDIDVGPSNPEDIDAANELGVPGFVGDLDHWIEKSDSVKKDYFELTAFGPEKRTKRLNSRW